MGVAVAVAVGLAVAVGVGVAVACKRWRWVLPAISPASVHQARVINPTPDKHFAASPHASVLDSCSGSVDSATRDPSVRAGIVSSSGIGVVEVIATPDDHLASYPYCGVTLARGGHVGQARFDSKLDPVGSLRRLLNTEKNWSDSLANNPTRAGESHLYSKRLIALIPIRIAVASLPASSDVVAGGFF